jgi:N-acetylmuramoyl-L-alanine amidase
MNDNYADLINAMPAEEVVARTAWGEARSLGQRGMQGVTNVIQARVANPSWWGFNWRGVCLARYQFSCWNDGDPNLHKLLNVTVADPQYVSALSLGMDAISGELPDIVEGADSYFDLSLPVPPYWAKGQTPVAEIGTLQFFKLRKT